MLGSDTSNLGQFTIQNCQITNNFAINGGGGLFVLATERYASLHIINCEFYQNLSISDGGAVYINGGSADGGCISITNSVFKNNSTQFIGGAIYYKGIDNRNSALKIENTLFENNYATYIGGAAYLASHQNDKSITINKCSFKNNASGSPPFEEGLGGALGIESSDTMGYSISNCIFEENLSHKGGAIFGVAFANIFNSLFKENKAILEGGAI